MTLLSGLCVGGSLVGTVHDLATGAAPLSNVLSITLIYLAVGGPFLAGGIALIVWGRRVGRRK